LAEAERRAPRTALPQQVALLAILDLAEEYVRAKKRVAEYQSQIQAKSDDLADRLSALNP